MLIGFSFLTSDAFSNVCSLHAADGHRTHNPLSTRSGLSILQILKSGVPQSAITNLKATPRPVMRPVPQDGHWSFPCTPIAQASAPVRLRRIYTSPAQWKGRHQPRWRMGQSDRFVRWESPEGNRTVGTASHEKSLWPLRAARDWTTVPSQHVFHWW